MTNLGDILVVYSGGEGGGEGCSCAALFELAEFGFHKLVIHVDLHVQIIWSGRLEVLNHDGGRWTERERLTIWRVDYALADKLKESLIGPEHKVLWVFRAGSALQAGLALVFLIQGHLAGLCLYLLHPLQGLVFQMGSQLLG